MNTETPRTDAALIERQSTVAVDADFARQLERELNAANERIASLEQVLDRIVELTSNAPGCGQYSTLSMIEATAIEARKVKP